MADAPARRPPSDAEFDAAFALLGGVFDPADADARFPRRPNAVYTAAVVLWMLTYQRMHPDKSLEAAVKHLLATQPALLPADHKRVREGTLSAHTGSYSDARHWLPTAAADWFADHVSRTLLADAPPAWNGRRVFLWTAPPSPSRRSRNCGPGTRRPPTSTAAGCGRWPCGWPPTS